MQQGARLYECRGPATSTTEGTGPPPRKGLQNLGAQVWGTTSTNGPVTSQPIPYRGFTEPLPEALSDIGYKRHQAYWSTARRWRQKSRAQADTSLEAAPPRRSGSLIKDGSSLFKRCFERRDPR